MNQHTVQLTYFSMKFTSYAQNVSHRPKRMSSDVCEVADSFNDRYLWQVVPDLLQRTF